MGLKWFGHVRRKGAGYIRDKMMGMELRGRRKRSPKRRVMDELKPWG